jgi:hypothetical protein
MFRGPLGLERHLHCECGAEFLLLHFKHKTFLLLLISSVYYFFCLLFILFIISSVYYFACLVFLLFSISSVYYIFCL